MQEIGTLVVVVLKARNLPDKHSLYKQDVFGQAALGASTKVTQVDVKGGQHPVWDEELRFTIYQKTKPEDRSLEVSCWRKEPRGAECIGKGTVDIEETLRTGEFDDWVKLEENGAYRGELYLEMTYFASGPPPLQRRKTKMPTNERLIRSSQVYAYPGIHPAQSPPPARGARPSTSPSRKPPTAVPAHTAGGGPTHLSPPTSTHVSPRTSPRAKYDALPPIPQDHLSPQTIPDILKPGNPKGDVHYSEKPHPRQSSAHSSPSHTPVPLAYGAYTAVSASPPQSPPRGPVAIPTHASPPGAFAVPTSLRAGPPPGAPRSTSSSPPGAARNMLPPQSSVHAHYPVSPPRSPSPPLPPLPASTQSAPYGYAPPPTATHVNRTSPVPYNAAPAVPQSEYPPQAYSQPQYHAQPPSVPHAHHTTPIPYTGPIHPVQNGTSPPYTQPPYYPPRQPSPHTQYSVPPSSQVPPHHSSPHAQYSVPPSSQAPPSFPVPSFPVPERYTVPAPLPPGEPEGFHTPTPAHPQPYARPQAPPSAPAPPPVPAAVPIPPVPVAPAEDPRKAALTRSLEQEERDKRLALELEREDEARKREAEERDRADEELARKLDMELNLVDDEH